MDGDRLDEDQIALVIRRASELDGQSPGGQPGLDLAVVEEAAVEAGLSRESVRRAVAELRAGALGPSSPANLLTVSRCVPGPAEEVDDILRRFMHKEQFQLRRDFGARSTWTRRQDVPARVRISLDKGIHRRMVLREAEQVEIAVAEEPGDKGMVMAKVAVDAWPFRKGHLAATGVGAGLGMGAGAVGALLLGMPETLLVLPAAVASGAGVGHLVGASGYRQTVDDLRTGLEGFLDTVERRRGIGSQP